MKAHHTFDAMFEDKLNTLMPYLVKTTRGNEDLIQEGAIGIWQSMKEQPYATNKYHTTKAKWRIISVSRGVGRSVDIPKQYPRKLPITLVHYDAFCGTASTCISAMMLKRDYVGIEISPEYHEIALKRLDHFRRKKAA